MTVQKSLFEIARHWTRPEIDGRTTSQPALLITDGASVTYGVNVTILDSDEELIGVPIARANREIFYGAEVGSPCRLRMTASGQWEVIGFSRSMPNTVTLIPITVSPVQFGAPATVTIGAATDRTLSVRPVTLGDLATLGGFGVVPLGVLAAYRGGTFLEFR